MADTREQRLQMRQRGAATHKTKAIDFGLSFGTPAGSSTTKTPARSRRLSRKTPQTSLSRRESTRQPSVLRSTRRSHTPMVDNRQRLLRHGEFDIPVDEEQDHRSASSSAKRRRLNVLPDRHDPGPSSTPGNAGSSSTNSLIQKRSTRKSAIPAVREQSISEEDGLSEKKTGKKAKPLEASMKQAHPNREPEAVESDLESSHLGRSSEPILSPGDYDHDKENTITEPSTGRPRANTSDTLHIPKPKRKKRKSIGQQRPKRRSLESVQEEPAVDIADARGGMQDEIEAESSPAVLSSKIKQKKMKRKSIGQKKPKKQSLESVQDNSVPPEVVVPRTTTNAGRPRKSPVRLEVVQEVPSGQQESSRSSVMVAQKGPSRKRRHDPDVPFDGEKVHNRKIPKNSIPIRVHRLSRTTGLRDDYDGEDELQKRERYERFPKRSGVNAADVLSQIWHDIIENALEVLKEEAQNEGNKTLKKELKRKQQVVSVYENELQDRLFDLSEAMDHNFSLSTRLKRAKKEKTALQEEFIIIGQEQEEVALKMDEVRRKHEESSKIAEEQNELNDSLHDLELALERERRAGHQDPSRLEFLLRTVTDDMSSLGNGGGFLLQVKDFNNLLEKIALGLERR